MFCKEASCIWIMQLNYELDQEEEEQKGVGVSRCRNRARRRWWLEKEVRKIGLWRKRMRSRMSERWQRRMRKTWKRLKD